jgi:D-glycero-D-manno-heptose 1,7-bisphosphate phosphatase
MVGQDTELLLNSSSGTRPAVLFDRDGVLNIDHGYVFRSDDLQLTDTAGKAVRRVNEAGYIAIVVSNQSGVARGMFSCADVERFHDAMQSALRSFGAHIDAFYYCPYHPQGSVADFAFDHRDRKPQPGMLLRAISDWSLDPARTIMIGDKQSDMLAATAAGVRGILVQRDLPDLADIIESALA